MTYPGPLPSYQINAGLKFRSCDEFSLSSYSECCRVGGTTSYLFIMENGILLVRLANKENAGRSTIFIAKVKSRRNAAKFSVRIEDSSATSYFQFY